MLIRISELYRGEKNDELALIKNNLEKSEKFALDIFDKDMF